MRDEPARGDGSGVTYSGYVVYAGELNYKAPDNGEVGYKVYIGPNQYFVITDIGNGRYQWYAFLAQPPGMLSFNLILYVYPADKIWPIVAPADFPFLAGMSNETPESGNVPHLANLFKDWSPDIHHILDATKEDEIACRDLYDR